MAAADRILFLTMTNDVGSDRVVSDLGRQGASCAVLGPAGCFAGLSRFVDARFGLPRRAGAWAAALVLRRRLASAVRQWNPERVVPLDELAALLLRTIAADGRTAPDIRALLVTSLGRVAGYAASTQRVALMKVAARLGVRVPAFTEAPASGSAGLPFPLYVKRDQSSGGGGVAMARDEAALKALLRRAHLKGGLKRILGRAAGFRHPPSPVLLQQDIGGALAMRTVVCHDGVVLEGVNFMAVQVHPKKRASTMLRAMDQPEMDEAARRLVAALGCSGFVSFDFVVDPAGHAYLIEMNPRPIGSTHLGRLFGHDLGRAFLHDTVQAPHPGTLLPRETVVALFPKELERDPESACLARGSDVFHDVPRDEPALVEAYLAHVAALHPGSRDSLRARLGTPVALAQDAWRRASVPEACA